MGPMNAEANPEAQQEDPGPRPRSQGTENPPPGPAQTVPTCFDVAGRPASFIPTEPGAGDHWNITKWR